MATITLTQADRGKTVAARPGDTITITLAENPTTGYRWAIEHQDQNVVHIVDDKYTSGGTSPGAGGTRTFTLQADHPGTAPFSVKLWREWVGDSSVSERFEVVVKISQ